MREGSGGERSGRAPVQVRIVCLLKISGSDTVHMSL